MQNFFLEQVPSNFSLTTLNKCPNFLQKNWFSPDEVSLRKHDNAKKDARLNYHNCLSSAPIGTIIREQQTFGESKFVCGDSMGPSTFQMVSMEQSSNPTSSIEGAIKEQVASSPEDKASSHEADEETKSLTVLSSPSSLRGVEKKFSLETSRNSGGRFRIIIDEETEEVCVPEVASNSENEDNSAYSSMSFTGIQF